MQFTQPGDYHSDGSHKKALKIIDAEDREAMLSRFNLTRYLNYIQTSKIQCKMFFLASMGGSMKSMDCETLWITITANIVPCFLTLQRSLQMKVGRCEEISEEHRLTAGKSLWGFRGTSSF